MWPRLHSEPLGKSGPSSGPSCAPLAVKGHAQAARAQSGSPKRHASTLSKSLSAHATRRSCRSSTGCPVMQSSRSQSWAPGRPGSALKCQWNSEQTSRKRNDMLHHTPTEGSQLALGEAFLLYIGSAATKKLLTCFGQGDDSRLRPGGATLCLSTRICRDRVISAQHIVHDALCHPDVHLQPGHQIWVSGQLMSRKQVDAGWPSAAQASPERRAAHLSPAAVTGDVSASGQASAWPLLHIFCGSGAAAAWLADHACPIPHSG